MTVQWQRVFIRFIGVATDEEFKGEKQQVTLKTKGIDNQLYEEIWEAVHRWKKRGVPT